MTQKEQTFQAVLFLCCTARCKLGFGKNCASSFTRFVECYIEKSSKEESEYYGHLEFAYKKCYVCDTPYIYSYVSKYIYSLHIMCD